MTNSTPRTDTAAGPSSLLVDRELYRRLECKLKTALDDMAIVQEAANDVDQTNQILSEACAKALNERDQWRNMAGMLAKALRGAQVLADCCADMNDEPQTFRDNNDNYMAIVDAIDAYNTASQKQPDIAEVSECGPLTDT